MGNKKVDEVITDYFSALLDEGSIEDALEEEKKEDVPVSTQQVSASPPETNTEPKPIAKTAVENTEPEPVKNETAPTIEHSSTPSQSTESRTLRDMSQFASSTSREKPDDSPAAPATAYEHHKQRLEKMLQQVSALETHTEAKVAPADTSVVQEQTVDVAAEEAVSEPVYQSLPPLSSEWLENGRPNWAQEQFDILLIEVNGLQLAVPLVALGQIQTIDEQLTPLFGQSDWFMGLQQSPIGNIKTVNTAKFVMPERYQDEHDYKYVVSINGLNWGLAVDCIHQPISIDPDSIRWRPNRSSRPWMAGMVKDHMCVLLDIPSMGELLQKQDKNHKETTGG